MFSCAIYIESFGANEYELMEHLKAGSNTGVLRGNHFANVMLSLVFRTVIVIFSLQLDER